MRPYFRTGWQAPRYGVATRRDARHFPANHRLPLAYRRGHAIAEPSSADPLARDHRLAWLEAVLLAADEPLTGRRLATLAGLADAAEVRSLIERLRELYDSDGTAFQVAEIAGGYQLLTREVYHPWLVRYRRSAAEVKLTPAALETLAIIAYRQPIMRADLEGIRGVQCGEILRQLMEKNLVRIVGRDESLGRPVLYGTTKKFLQVFGLNSLKDLPPVDE